MNKIGSFFSILLLSFFTVFTLPAFSESINVELISYEDKKDFEGKDTCELEFTFTNNAWGTIYGLSINTESYDDRESKIDGNLFSQTITPFAIIFGDVTSIKKGNTATAKSLNVDSKCKYIEIVYMTKVKQENCNIRMMPEEANCLDIVTASSKIDHIKLIKK
jgi:hypothetical protein|tara:strand:+ start:954 stop:1442 length:489 start_codon:yes stop_codon:yes gene_type:complete